MHNIIDNKKSINITRRIVFAVMSVIMTFMLVSAAVLFESPKKAYADDDDSYYYNSATGYEAVIEDDAELMTDAEHKQLLAKMQEITKYGNVMFKSIDYNSTTTKDYVKNLYRNRYGSESGTIFIIDMDNRNIWIHSNGRIYSTITNSYSDTITDNVYSYATGKKYYTCAYKVYEQELTLLQGRRISQPMKYISNALLAMVAALLINYAVVRIYSSNRKASRNSIMKGIFTNKAFNNYRVDFSHQTKTYSPRSSDSGSSGGSSGGGGGSSGGGGGGGGGHSF